MKKSIFLIILLALFAMLASSCTGYTASTPGKQFCRGDWDVCGFKPWVNGGDLEKKLGAKTTVCGDSNESWSTGYSFNGGGASVNCHWILEYKRLYTRYSWNVTVTNMWAGVALPRGLYIGSSIEQVKNEFGLGEADVDGLYYGDGVNAPYAKYRVLKYEHESKKEVTFAIPAGETDDTGDRYICSFSLVFDPQDRLESFSYGASRMYSILPGLPEPEQVDEVRQYTIGKEQPDIILKFEDVKDVLGCIQEAGQTPVEAEVTPTHSIEIVSGGEVFTLKYGDGLIEAPDGRVYEIRERDEDVLFASLPGLCAYKNSYIIGALYKTVQLSAEQDAEIKRIIGSMVPGSENVPAAGQCCITVYSGDSYDSYTYLFGTPNLISGGNSYHISYEDADTIRRIYSEAFGPGLSLAYLIPGVIGEAEITDVHIWRIGEEGIIYKWKPYEAALLLDIIIAGRNKPLKEELESPTHKILIKGGNSGYNLELTVGSNGIKAQDGKGYEVAYEVVFPDYVAKKYLFPDGTPLEEFPSDSVYDRLTVMSETSGQFYSFGEHQTEVQDIINSMEKCEGTKPDSIYCTISGVVGETYFKFIYYIGTQYIVYKDELYSISGEKTQALTNIYNELFK